MGFPKMTMTDLAVSIKPFVDHFVKNGSIQDILTGYDREHIVEEIVLLLDNSRDVDWDWVGVDKVGQFKAIAETICIEILYKTPTQEQSPYELPNPIIKNALKHEGYIYLIKGVFPSKCYKIGLTKEPKSRISTLGVQLPFPIEVIHLIKTNDMRGLEKALHNKYADKRVNGEWFALTDSDVQEICSMKGDE